MQCPTLAELPSPPPGKTGWPWTLEASPLSTFRAGESAWPKVTIVTPSFNQGQFIEETIRSVLLQGYPNLEFLIADGGSTDGSVDIIKKYSSWISYWKSGPDNGQVDALNRTLPMASGDLLNWLNSDDLLLPGALFTIAELWSLSRSEVDIVSGARILRYTRPFTEQIQLNWIDKWPVIALGLPCFPQEATFVSRRLWEKIGSFDERLQHVFDTAFYAKALGTAIKIMLTTAPISVMHVHPMQKTLRDDKKKAAEIHILQTEYFPKLGFIWRLLTRALSTRFTRLAEAIVRPMVLSRARSKFFLAYYDPNDGKWKYNVFL
jgi:glycosyltransferase involved in cell wall biosynthesis